MPDRRIHLLNRLCDRLLLEREPRLSLLFFVSRPRPAVGGNSDGDYIPRMTREPNDEPNPLDLSPADMTALRACTLCPRRCRADRASTDLGYCATGTAPAVSSICAHRGEEPAISGRRGICNIFFAHCNLQCIYCQNHQISSNRTPVARFERNLAGIVAEVEMILDAGARGVGFVSPSHSLRQMRAIMHALRAGGRDDPFVFNTNAYDHESAIRDLAGDIDVYLPDLKYMDGRLAAAYSDAPDYVPIATSALREMYRQKGAELRLDGEGTARNGLIIRHLVLPGHVENSKAVLRFIAENLSPEVHISLMSQYHQTPAVADHPVLGRRLHPEEYEEVLDEFESLGFSRGWAQELASADHYRPDFRNQHPFE